jgi:hypothetical protein
MENKQYQVSGLKGRTKSNYELSTLPMFTLPHHYDVYYINWATPTSLLHDLIQYARQIKEFTVDTENQNYSNRPALIQIEMIGASESIVLLLEMFHLPHESSVLFWLMKSLLKIILHPSKLIQSWGNASKQLELVH